MRGMSKFVVHHIPVCPFSQRLKILMALKGLPGEVEFHVVDITRPRDERLLELARGTTALPIVEFATRGEDTLRFELQVTPEGAAGPIPVRFEQAFPGN